MALPNAEELPISDIERFHIALDFQMAARYAANKQINLKKMEASFREMIERLDCPEDGRSQSYQIINFALDWRNVLAPLTILTLLTMLKLLHF